MNTLTATARKILPEKEIPVMKFLEEQANEEGTTVAGELTAIADFVKTQKENALMNEVTYGSMLRVNAQEQTVIAEGMKKNGVNSTLMIQAAIATVALAAFTKPIIGVITKNLGKSLDVPAKILPEKDLPMLNVIKKNAAKNNQTPEQFLADFSKGLNDDLLPVEMAEKIVDAASSLRISDEDQTFVADTMIKNGIKEEKLVQAAVALQGIGALMQSVMDDDTEQTDLQKAAFMQRLAEL